MKCTFINGEYGIIHSCIKTQPQLLHSVTAFPVNLDHLVFFLQRVCGVCVGECERTGLRVKITHAFGFVPAFSVQRRPPGEATAVLDLVGQVGRPLVVARTCALLRGGEEHH